MKRRVRAFQEGEAARRQARRLATDLAAAQAAAQRAERQLIDYQSLMRLEPDAARDIVGPARASHSDAVQTRVALQRLLLRAANVGAGGSSRLKGVLLNLKGALRA